MYEFIGTDSALDAYLGRIRARRWIAFDTEFISEGKYRAELCLIQVATESGLVLIDAPAITDLSPFWERLCGGKTTVITHSCRSEMEFCHRGIGRLPESLFDIQLAAGFVGIDYPAGFKKLGEVLLGIEIPKGETRTDWRKRPLSPMQTEYALADVRYLKEMADRLRERLKKLGRMEWFKAEMGAHRAGLLGAFADERWGKIPGAAGLGRRERGIVRGLERWRDAKASATNRPKNHLLRDDLIIELARRKSANPERIGALRGLANRSDSATLRAELAGVIAEALALDESALPNVASPSSYPTYSVVVQLLMTVLGNIAHRSLVAPSLLATPQDVRQFVASRGKTLPSGCEVKLDSGWRKELIGDLLDDVLAGRTLLRVADLTQNDPIELVQ